MTSYQRFIVNCLIQQDGVKVLAPDVFEAFRDDYQVLSEAGLVEVDERSRHCVVVRLQQPEPEEPRFDGTVGVELGGSR